LICASAPVGYNTITFSVLRDLDNEFAASAVSLSAFAGLLIYPFMHYYLTG
jgi:predicted permease